MSDREDGGFVSQDIPLHTSPLAYQPSQSSPPCVPYQSHTSISVNPVPVSGRAVPTQQSPNPNVTFNEMQHHQQQFNYAPQPHPSLVSVLLRLDLTRFLISVFVGEYFFLLITLCNRMYVCVSIQISPWGMRRNIVFIFDVETRGTIPCKDT